MKRTPLGLTAAAVAAFAIGFAGPAHAEPAPNASECVEQGNVWIHVEHDEETAGACATEFATVLEATQSTKLTTDVDSFITTIDGRTADDTKREWWSLWSYSPEADGSDGKWDFSQVGAHEMKLEGGEIVAWSLQPDWNINPGPAPKVDPMEAAAESADANDSDEADSGPNTGLMIGIAAGAVVVIGGAAIVLSRRKKG